MGKIEIKYVKTVVGELIIGSYQNQLCLCDWRYRKMRNRVDERIKQGLNADFLLSESDIINLTIEQLNEYFEKARCEFSIPLLLVGTDFQKRVWQMLQQVPFGSTQTYLGLSKMLNNEKAVRAVASANGANALAILIPCHRIVGSNGELVGYAGGLPAKKTLLTLENRPDGSQMLLF